MRDKAPPERIDPEGELPGVIAHHLRKYEFADSVLSDGSVLDIGCGFAYGSAYLASPGRRVIGVDVSTGTLAKARLRYGRAPLSLVAADANTLPFLDHSFDSVVSFELIEHLEIPEAFVSEVCRVMKGNGCFVMSTPRPGLGASPDKNPFHHHEFTKAQLQTMLESFFQEVELLGQRRVTSGPYRFLLRADVFNLRRVKATRPLVRAVALALRTSPVEGAALKDFLIDRVGSDSGTEFIAVCRGPRG